MKNNFNYLLSDQSKDLYGDQMVKVGNGSPQWICYLVPDMNVRREFRPLENGKMDEKYVTFEELFNLNNTPGGRELLYEHLVINDETVREALDLPFGEDAPEFAYTEEDVKNVLLNGSDDEVLDMYDFGPERMAKITKSLLVDLDNISYSRLELLENIFGWSDISRMIKNWKGLEEEKGASSTRRTRRSKEVKEEKPEEKTGGRRARRATK